ncbi:MAG: hypothetical protein ACRD1K_15730 [Acidimicrobiales bacterium]
MERPGATLDRSVEGQELGVGPAGAVALRPFSLATTELLAHSEWLGSAPPGRAWLALGLRDFAVPRVSGSVSVRLDLAASFSLVLAGGQVVPAVEMGEPGVGLTVYFDVPEDLRSFVVRVTPTFGVEGGPAPGPLVFATAEVPVELRPGALGDDRRRPR